MANPRGAKTLPSLHKAPPLLDHVEHASLDTQLPSSNVGFRLLQKMGWKGKGHGKNEQDRYTGDNLHHKEKEECQHGGVVSLWYGMRSSSVIYATVVNLDIRMRLEFESKYLVADFRSNPDIDEELLMMGQADPIKVNVSGVEISMDRLPTRVNLHRRGVQILLGLFVIGGAWFGTLLIRIDLGYLVYLVQLHHSKQVLAGVFYTSGGVSGHIETISSSLIQIFEKMVFLKT
ncbi:RNA-directed DNA polymerase, eukaryota [Tanacetum coccineum]